MKIKNERVLAKWQTIVLLSLALVLPMSMVMMGVLKTKYQSPPIVKTESLVARQDLYNNIKAYTKDVYSDKDFVVDEQTQIEMQNKYDYDFFAKYYQMLDDNDDIQDVLDMLFSHFGIFEFNLLNQAMGAVYEELELSDQNNNNVQARGAVKFVVYAGFQNYIISFAVGAAFSAFFGFVASTILKMVGFMAALPIVGQIIVGAVSLVAGFFAGLLYDYANSTPNPYVTKNLEYTIASGFFIPNYTVGIK